MRCIKPNNLKKANSFIDDDVIVQLRYSGMLDIIRIKREVGHGLIQMILLPALSFEM